MSASLLVWALICPAARAQESARFILDRLTLAGGATELSSARFDLRATLAREVPVGSASACNHGLAHGNGFWSLLVELPSPLLLRVDLGATDPSIVELTWTGSDPIFGVYRGESPAGVAMPVNLLVTTSSCAAADVPPSSAPIVYYLVEPAGP